MLAYLAAVLPEVGKWIRPRLLPAATINAAEPF